MKIIIGSLPTYAQEGIEFPSQPKPPHEIRDFLARKLEEPEEVQASLVFYTCDRTVLGEVSEHGRLSYENVSILTQRGTLAPLLSVHPSAYLSHFNLGDLYSRKSKEWSEL